MHTHKHAHKLLDDKKFSDFFFLHAVVLISLPEKSPQLSTTTTNTCSAWINWISSAATTASSTHP